MNGFSGGCSCGAVRFAINDYLCVQACHCDACKKRTGSAYGLSVMIDNDSLAEFVGETKTLQAHRGKRQAGALRVLSSVWHYRTLANRDCSEPPGLCL